MLRPRLPVAWLGSLIAVGGLLTGCGVDDDNLSPADDYANYRNETSTNWSMSRGYPRNTAFNPFEQELAPDTAAGLQEIWHIDNTAPTLIQHAEQIFTNTGQAYGTNSGTFQWAADSLPNPVFCKGLVFGTGTIVQGYQPANGMPSPDTGIPAATQFGLPTAKDSSLIFAGVTDADEGLYFTYNVVSNELATLTMPYRTLAPAALTANQIYAPGLDSSSNYVVTATTFDQTVATKRKEWSTVIDRIDPGLDPAAAAVPTLGVMVIGARVFGPSAAGDAVFALDQRSGALIWRTAAIPQIVSLAASFDYVYAAGSDAEGQLVVQAFASGSGTSRFVVKLGSARLTGQLAIGGGMLYLGTNAGELVAIEAATGVVSKRLQLGGVVGDPLVTGGRVIAATGERIVALGLPPAPVTP